MLPPRYANHCAKKDLRQNGVQDGRKLVQCPRPEGRGESDPRELRPTSDRKSEHQKHGCRTDDGVPEFERWINMGCRSFRDWPREAGDNCAGGDRDKGDAGDENRVTMKPRTISFHVEFLLSSGLTPIPMMITPGHGNNPRGHHPARA